MTQPSWYSEPYPPTGAVAAEGVRSQLGRPKLSLIEVLVREAIQNSWDARLGTSPVRFEIGGRECTAQEQLEIRQLLAPGAPAVGLSLAEVLEREPLRLLVVSDRGTTGLGGPTRADIEVPGYGPHDFVAFIRNVGEPRDKELGGGTYGFGKTIFYLLSGASTTIVYTRCRLGETYESRLIGCALGESFRNEDGDVRRPHTGRHWWGIARDGVQEPLLNDEADAIAAKFGLPVFEETETGTTIVMLAPNLEDPVEDMHAIAWAIAWNAWPKMVDEPPEMQFAVRWNGEEVSIPDPQQTPPLDAFVAAYLDLGNGAELECGRPRQVLGRLSLHRRMVRARQPDAPSSFQPPISSPIHHVALMRAPHLVVSYYAGSPLAGDVAEYGGVFKAEHEIDDAFARAEPPTHDDWIPNQLVGHWRTFIRTTFQRLDERLAVFARPATLEFVGGAGIPLGAASSRFASLVATATGQGGTTAPGRAAGRSDDGGTRGGGSERLESGGSLEELGEPEFAEYRGTPAILFGFRVRRAEPGMRVTARAAVGLDEGLQSERAQEAPTGAAQPQVLGWLGPGGEIVDGSELPAEQRVGEIWKVAVAPVANTVTTLSLRFEGMP